jgi:putative inorganic carbon (HCO3(-)) transporter
MFVSLITFLYHSLFLITPLLFFWGNSELFELNKMLFIYVIAILVGGLWLARSIHDKKIYWKNHYFVNLLLIFLAGQFVSTIFSIHWATSISGYYSRINGGFLSSLAYTVLALGIWNNVPHKKLLTFFISHSFGLLLVSLYALPEHFGFSPSCLILHQTFDTSCWKQDVQARVFGTFGQPNWLASYIIGVFPLVFFLRDQYKKALPWLGEIILLISTLVVWYTKSKSGIFGLLLVSLLILFLRTYKKNNLLKKIWQNKLFLPFSTTTTILVVIISGFLLHQRTMNDLNSLDLSQGTDSFSIRTIVWEGAIKVWQRYPATGSGPATFAYSFYQDRPALHNLVSEWDFLYNKAHNEFLNYLSETGIIGFSGYMVFLLGTIYLLWKNGQKYKSWANSSWMVLVSMLGLSAVHFFGFSIAATNLLLFTLPVLALNPEIKEKQIKTKLNSWWQYLAIILVAIFSFNSLKTVTNFWNADRLYKKSKDQQFESKYLQASESLQEAIKASPKEAIYYDELSDVYSVLAFQYDVVGRKDVSNQLAEAAIENSNYALILNPRHLNFYKTRARVFLVLAQSDKKYYTDAEHTLLSAIELSPNDAKLYYNLGLVQKEMGKLKEAQESLEKTVYLKPNYLKARSELAYLYAETKQPEKSLGQFDFIINHLAVNDPEYLNMRKNVEATASGILNDN